MQRFEIVWHGGLVGAVEPWSGTRGELLAPRRQRLRGFGADPESDGDAERQPPMLVSSLTLAPPWRR